MRFSSVLALLFLSLGARAATELPRFVAKHAVDQIRFVTHDGRFSYTQKRSGALALATSFKSSDVIEGALGTNYYVTASAARRKQVVEVERAWHQDYDLTKVNTLLVGSYAGTQFTEVGKGRFPQLHLDDDWLSWYDPKEKVIHLQFLKAAERHHVIRLGIKHNPFFVPDVVMLNPETVLYTDVNDKGHAALLSWNIVEKKMTVLRKAERPGSKMELCRYGNFVALGEFSYDDANLGSQIHVMSWKNNPSLAGLVSLYRVADNDLGNLVCTENTVWFVKTLSEDRRLNTKVTEAASLDIATSKLRVHSELERVTQLIEMDGRVLLPYRDEIFVLSGYAGSAIDVLKAPEKAPGAPKKGAP